MTKHPHIVVDVAIPFIKGVLEPWAEVEYLPSQEISRAAVRNADAVVVRTRTRCDAALLEGSRVRLVVTATIGFDHIDCKWCADNGIRVATAAGCNARGVLQWVAAALVYISECRGWQPGNVALGVVGVGHVGSLVADCAARWGFRVLRCDPPRQERESGDFLPLDAVAREADILTLHTPLDATTYHMVDDRLLSLMKPSSVIINTSRGAVVDGEALCKCGRDFVLDVWEGEPLIDAELLRRALIATPHIAGYSEQGKATAAAMAVAAVAEFFSLPLHGWYPEGAAPSVPHPITWPELCATIRDHYDIAAESDRLKKSPREFEATRDGYLYRREYF